MKKKFFVLIVLSACLMLPANAKKTTKEYQRPSLNMVLMTSSENASNGTVQITDPTILGFVSDAWDSYEFPALYNDFRTTTTAVSVDKAKGGIMDILATYNDPNSLNGLSIDQLKDILTLMEGKKYLESLKEEVDKISDKIAHELVKKWWSIQDDGTCSDTLIIRLACYAATQNQSKDAAQTQLGAVSGVVNQLSNIVINNTYVTFTKVEFYENEPIAAFTRNVMTLIAGMTPAPANIAATKAAEKTYESMKEGYSAFANALLYQLQWNDSIANEFYSIWGKDGKIDMAKFNDMKFSLKYCGATKCSATCMMKKSDVGAESKDMVEKTIYKALDRKFVDLQKEYEEFRPMVPVLGIDTKGGIIADMGTKEGVKVKDKFVVYDPYTDENGIVKYKNVGSVKVVQWSGEQFVEGVWDNQSYDNVNSAAAADGTETEIIGTHTSKFKNATPSMLVKQVSTK